MAVLREQIRDLASAPTPPVPTPADGLRRRTMWTKPDLTAPLLNDDESRV
jgi:hypothetical protein